MPHKQYIHKPTVIKELTIIVVANLCFFIIFQQIDMLEWLYELSRRYEYLEVDEFFTVGITLAISLLIFSYRRIIELGLMARTLEQMSLVDSLTGLPNRRAGQISLITWCELAEKNNQLFTVYQIDLDAFKKVNNMFGQMIGDEALKLVAQLLNKFIPKSALLCRWLDDNFLVVILNDSINNPHEYAYKLQDTINGKVLTNTLDVTSSIGYKIWQKGQSVEDVLHDADDALINAKHAGKNQIKGN